MQVKAGTKLASAVCETQVVVVRAPADDVDLGCGGAPLVGADEGGSGGEPDPALAEGTLIGKRYADEELGIELLCTKAGAGSLTCNGTVLAIKGAKPLPASD
jgi:hypothetical protein